MATSTHTLTLPAAMLKRGFWLYVWRVEGPEGIYLYVGRTGDSSSPNAKPPYQRMGQHLGHQKNQNALRKYLERRGIKPERCHTFHLVAHGPLFPQAVDMNSHKRPRNIVAALEKALAVALIEAGYEVMNKVNSRMPLDRKRFAQARRAFAAAFPKLRKGGMKG